MKGTAPRLGALLLASFIAGLLALWLHPELSARRQGVAPADELTVDALPAWSSEALWVDARGRAAYETGHVPGALWLPAEDYDAHVAEVFEKWKEGQRVIVYCDGEACGASRHVAERLRTELALGETYYLKGGWDAWKRAHE